MLIWKKMPPTGIAKKRHDINMQSTEDWQRVQSTEAQSRAAHNTHNFSSSTPTLWVLLPC
jgi:hypothetical protein